MYLVSGGVRSKLWVLETSNGRLDVQCVFRDI